MTELLYKELTFAVTGAAMGVHRILGPGFLEAVYQAARAGEYIADFMIDRKLIVEIKAVSNFHSQHQAQAMQYLAATGCRLALLLNVGTSSLEHRHVIKEIKD